MVCQPRVPVHCSGCGDTAGVVEELRTPRLVLRPWRESDEAEMVRVNREPEVGRFLNRPVDDAAIAGFYGAMTDHWQRRGYGPWVVESAEPGSQGRFLGFAGLAHVPPFLAAAGELPELGWRLIPLCGVEDWPPRLPWRPATMRSVDCVSPR